MREQVEAMRYGALNYESTYGTLPAGSNKGYLIDSNPIEGWTML